MGTRLLSQQGVNAPAALEPYVDACRLKGVDHFDDVICAHHAGMVVVS